MATARQTYTHKLELRARRLIYHILVPGNDPYLGRMLRKKKILKFLLHYVFELPLRILDVLGLPEIFQFFQKKLKPHARELYEHELKLTGQIFSPDFDLRMVRIDEDSTLGTRKGKYAYVSFCYINCRGMLQLPILIHEVVHILQFAQDGSPYAFRNMVAHIWGPTYNYGGLDRLHSILDDPGSLHDLNYEQRADIYSDYCHLLLGQRPEWGRASLQDAIHYYKVIKLLNEPSRMKGYDLA